MTFCIAFGHTETKLVFEGIRCTVCRHGTILWKIIGQEETFPHAAYYLGLSRGFFEEEGIDLTINEGSGSGTAANLVANKQDTFGLADAAALIPLVEKGLPIKCVGMITPRTSLAVATRRRKYP